MSCRPFPSAAESPQHGWEAVSRNPFRLLPHLRERGGHTIPQPISTARKTCGAAPAPQSIPVPDLAYLTPYLASRNAFLQFYTDRIRFGLPRGDLDPEDFSLLLVYPEDTPRQPWMHPSPAVPCCVLPLETATPDDTPPTFATDPALPYDARTSRRSRTAIALLPLADPYPEAVFLFPVPPDTLSHWLSTHPSADFGDLEAHWHTSQPFSPF